MSWVFFTIEHIDINLLWEIEKIRVDYECEGEKPYTVNWGAITLDEPSEVSLWQDPPVPTFDV